MFDLFNSEDHVEGIYGTLFRDIILVMVAGLIAIVIIMIPYINDPGKKKEDDVSPPGNVIFEMFWDDNANVDIDGWVLGPGDSAPVGWTNRASSQFNLLRDDRGHRNDHSGRNYENFYSRGVLPGEYVFNTHWYSDISFKGDHLIIRIIVSVKSDDKNSKSSSEQILAVNVKLVPNEDKTVVRFKLDEKGKLIKHSVHNEYVNLKSFSGVAEDGEE